GRLLHQARVEAQRIRSVARAEIGGSDEPARSRPEPTPIEAPSPRPEPPSIGRPSIAAVRAGHATVSPAVPAPAPPSVRMDAPYLTRTDGPSAAPLLDGLDDVTPRRRWRMPLGRRGRRVA